LFYAITISNTSSKTYFFCASNTPRIVNDRHEIISIGGISITAASMAEFISGGVLSSYILQAFTECLMYDEENGKKARIFLAPQDYVSIL